jgi:rRNA pseudouridine-1189 N-methylase Emg1 (Nep1/Mra1 family)
MKFSRNSEAGPDFLIVIFGAFPKGEIFEENLEKWSNFDEIASQNFA